MSPRAMVAWGALTATLLAIGVTAVMSRRWIQERGEGAGPAVYSTLPAFELTNRDGRVVGGAELAGRPWVADLIFTRCGGTCPRLTSRMIALGERLPALRRVSISVDPTYDTPEVLEAYAAAYRIVDPDWFFLTGPVSEVEGLAREGFKLAVESSPPEGMAPPEEPILHSTRFVLVDADGRVRGYYDAFDEAALERLVADAEALTVGRSN